MTDPKTPDQKKPERRTFDRQLIVDFVDLMMLGDQIVAEYKRRKEDGGESGSDFMGELDFHDRVGLASTLMGLQTKDAIVGDVEIRRTAFEKMKELEALRKAEEAGQAQVAQGQPAFETVRVDPKTVELAFAKLSEENGIPNARARQFVKLLMTTDAGHQMLQLMLHDVVQQQREERKQAKGG